MSNFYISEYYMVTAPSIITWDQIQLVETSFLMVKKNLELKKKKINQGDVITWQLDT